MSALDVAIFRFLHAALSGHVVLWIMAALTVIGEGWTLVAFLPLLAFAKTRRFGGALVGTCVVTGIVVFALKAVVQRVRPCNCLTDVHARIFSAPSDYSFPSGHAAGSFACAAFVAAVLLAEAPRRPERWAAAVMVLALATGIALSRIALGVHFPGDVAAGALLGASAGVVGARMYAKKTI